jgi:hypothetical protein
VKNVNDQFPVDVTINPPSFAINPPFLTLFFVEISGAPERLKQDKTRCLKNAGGRVPCGYVDNSPKPKFFKSGFFG